MRELIMSLFIVFIVSCTKEGAVVTVEGRVYNPLTGEGAEGIEVKLIRDKVGGAPGAQSAGTTAEDISVTDENGIYNLNGVLGREVRYYVDGNKYHSIGVGNNSITGDPTYSGRIGIKAGKHNKVDFWVVPYGEFKLGALNTDCQGEGDLLIVDRIFLLTPDKKIFGTSTLYGCSNVPGTWRSVPSGNWRISWSVTKNNITNHFHHDFELGEGEQYEYLIEY